MRGIGVAVITSTSVAVALGGEGEALVDAEAVLLVDHDQPEVAEVDAGLEDGVGADDEVDVAGGEAGERPPRARGRARGR